MPIFAVNFLTFVCISHLAQHPDFWYPDFTNPRYPEQNFRQMSLDKIPAGSLSPTKPDWKLLRHGNTHCSSATIYISSNTHLLSISWQILYRAMVCIHLHVYTYSVSITCTSVYLCWLCHIGAGGTAGCFCSLFVTFFTLLSSLFAQFCLHRVSSLGWFPSPPLLGQSRSLFPSQCIFPLWHVPPLLELSQIWHWHCYSH